MALMRLELGQPAPDLRLEHLEGGGVRLRDLLGRPLVLIFLRHLG